MTLFIFSYLLYNILAGIILSISYYRTEGSIVDSREFLWLILFPAVGLGRWRYNQKMRLPEEVEFPERWFVYKYMVTVNWGYIISIGVILFLGLLGFGGLFGSGLNWANHQDNQNAIGFGLLADFGILFLLFLFSIIAVFGLGFLFLILIFIPKHSMKKIETEIYKQKYLEESRKNNQDNIT